MSGSRDSHEQTARRLLVIDDNPDDVLVLRLAAEDLVPAIVVDALDSGDLLVDHAARPAATVGDGRDRPAAVLLDWNLPGTGAPAVIEHLRTDPSWDGVPIVVYSGEDDPALAAVARSLGADGFEPKPTGIDGVTDMISRIMVLGAPAADGA